MLSAIIETIASTLAEHFAGKAVEKGLQKTGKASGWITLVILILIFAFVTWLGIFLFLSGVWPIGLLMFAIAAFIAYITIASVVKGKKRQ